jgi:hypothetical protein
VCLERRREQRAWDDVFLREVYPATVDRVVEEVIGENRVSARGASWSGRRLRVGWAMGIAASLLLTSGLYFLFSTSTEPASSAEYLADKGLVGLEVWCRRTGRVFRVQQGDKLFDEDMIRFVPRFQGEPSRFVMVVSIDSRGVVNRYFPAHSETAEQVTEPGVPLPGSTVLDDTGGPERIVLLASEEAFRFEEVRRAVETEWRKTGSAVDMGPLMLDLEQTSLLFYKD